MLIKFGLFGSAVTDYRKANDIDLVIQLNWRNFIPVLFWLLCKSPKIRRISLNKYGGKQKLKKQSGQYDVVLITNDVCFKAFISYDNKQIQWGMPCQPVIS